MSHAPAAPPPGAPPRGAPEPGGPRAEGTPLPPQLRGGVRDAVRDALRRALPTEWRGNDAFTTHLPAEEVAARGPVRVLRFAPAAGAPRRAPLLFVYSLINRYYILDFMPGRSLLEFFTSLGRPCYVIDWGVPGREDRHKTWEDYALRYVRVALDAMEARGDLGRGAPAHVFGYCVGGALALTFAALRPGRVRSLIAMATPVDFHDEGLLSRWTAPSRFDVDQVVEAYGHVPTWLLEGGFRMLSPLSNLTKWRDLWRGREREGFVATWRRMEQWSSDNVPFPAEVYRQYIRDTYQTNALYRGEMVVGGARVDLRGISAPTLAVIATRDNVVPPRSARALADLLPPRGSPSSSSTQGTSACRRAARRRASFGLSSRRGWRAWRPPPPLSCPPPPPR